MNQFVQHVGQSYDSYKAHEFTGRRFTPEMFHTLLRELAQKSNGLMTMEKAGESFERRPIYCVRMGNGLSRILLWSQMHGDESTATMAIVDIFNYFMNNRDTNDIKKMLSSLTLTFVPMLNPDGAERFQRRTAQGIDMNRDALALRTPEARLLRDLQQSIKPEFGFNLHDQELSAVGLTKNLTAIALLAPAYDKAKSDNAIRARAKLVAAVFTATMQNFIPENMARYDDSFEPRAFGDNMQKWETSTVLVESGHALNDPEKNSIRKLNAIGILSCCHAIATGTYQKADTSLYEQLPFNGKRAYDIIIRNVRIDYGEGKTAQADLGISYQVDTHSESTSRLVDLGDLHPFTGLKEIDGKETMIHFSFLSLGNAFNWKKFF